MQSYVDILCVLFVLQITIGVFGNFIILYLYVCNLITSQKRRPLDLIFINLSFSHIVIILFKGIPYAIQVCNQTVFMGDTECKIIIYLQRVARGVSLGTSCLLSVYQFMTISYGSSKFLEAKCRSPRYIVQSCVFIWVLNFLTDIGMPLYVNGPRNYTNNILSYNLGHCSIDMYVITNAKLALWKLLYDALFVGLMAITSLCIVVFLYHHHRQVKHIHKTRQKSSSSPESRATKVVLLLMSIFLFFHSVSSIFITVMDNYKFFNQFLINLSVLFSLCYPVITPFVLISSDSHILHCCNTFKRKVLFSLIKFSE